MGPAVRAAENKEPLQELRVDGNGHLETVGQPEPPCNCKKSQTGPVVVALIVLSSALITAIIALAVLSGRSSVALGSTCPDCWVGYRGKCYYFSEAEGNWNNIQSNCSSLGALLAGINTPQDLDFMLRYKGQPHHWIGLRRDPGQPWKWTNGTEFNNLFLIGGGGDCTYLNGQGGVSSLRCISERYWICT